MKISLPVYPFDAKRCIGSVCEVGPDFAKCNLPDASEPDGQWHHGHRLAAGEIGEFVIIEQGEVGVFGRIVKVELPESERISVEPKYKIKHEARPLGRIQLLTTIYLKDGQISSGIAKHPRLGSKVYSAHPSILKFIAESDSKLKHQKTPILLNLASLPLEDVLVNISPARIFGRHCAILGATGGGKSWTLARIMEQIAQHKSKAILFDATGEFGTLDSGTKHIHIGNDPDASGKSVEVVIPYSRLTESDLLALFSPSGQTQAPKLRCAMKSLKLAKLEVNLAKNGVLIKASSQKEPYEKAYAKHLKKLESPQADFDIELLTEQIDQECIWQTDRNDAKKFGQANETERGYCVSLITRIEEMRQSNALACIFNPGSKKSIFDEIDAFIKDDAAKLLRVSLKYLPFDHNAREITANAIGRYLLYLAREGKFRAKPLVVFLDEAHQFLNKSLGEENGRFPLDAFELIAKEGRKYSLNVCLSTQRPRDIPEGVLSQMGTLIVHRLINERDREVVERASGDIDRSAAAFLPTLAPGQAVIIGVDIPMPLTVQINKPGKEPDSRGPDYQTHWALT